MIDAGATWTDDRVEVLKRLWNEGLSASQIAAELGGVSRNAVIGKVHRLGLSGRGKAPAPGPGADHAAAARPKPKAMPRPPSAPTPVQAADPEPDDLDVEPATIMPPQIAGQTELPALATSERVTIMELRESMCRWPLGDPTKPDFGFCGGRAITGLPYCSHHAQIAYQPATERRRDRRLASA
ncbi:MAG TPA: GcrA family cell cycle regulator [Beijerinckiaceae bacterium]